MNERYLTNQLIRGPYPRVKQEAVRGVLLDQTFQEFVGDLHQCRRLALGQS